MLLIRRTLRRRPGQALTIFLLALLAAVTAHTALVLVTDYVGNIDRKAEEWNSPTSVTIVDAGAPAHRLAGLLAEVPAISAVEIIDSYGGNGTLDINGEQLSTMVNVIDMSRPGEMGAPRVVEGEAGDGILVPSALQAAGAYAIGDEISLDTAQGVSTFRVDGFIEDLYGGAPGMGTLTFGLRGAEFAALDAPGFQPTHNIRLQENDVPAASAAFDDLMSEVQSTLEPGESLFPWSGHDIAIAKAAAGMSSSIFVAILGALAVVIMGIAVVVTWFVLRNLITNDMTSIGTLRAAGFTTPGIMGSLVAAYGLLTGLGAILGSALSYLALPVMATSFRAQNGIGWRPGFSWLAGVVTVAALLAVVALTAGVAALRVRSVSTVAALRGGIATHSFSGDHLPLATTRGPLATLLGLKAGLCQSGQNALLALTVAVVSFAGVFTLGMVDNLLGDKDKATELMIGNLPDVSVAPKLGVDAPQLLADVAALPGVDDAFFLTFHGFSIEGLPIGFGIMQDPSARALDQIAEGRMPRHENEIAVGGRLATVAGLDVGDTYTLDLGLGEASYVVTGITSSARHMGQTVNLSSDAYRRLLPSFEDSAIAVFTEEPERVIVEAKARFGAQLDSVTNERENVEAQLSSYLSLVPIISTFMIVFVMLVTVLVVALLVTTMLVQTRRELGIKKAVGFTNRELSAQTRWTYLPAIGIGAAAGAVAGAFALSPLLQVLLGQIGVVKVGVAASWVMTAGIALLVVAIGVAVLWASSLRIGRVSAYALVTE